MTEKTISDQYFMQNSEESAVSRTQAVLVVLEGEDTRIRHTLRLRETFIGRDDSNEIPLTDVKASRRHAVLVYENQQSPAEIPIVRLKDLKSTNGSFVNGENTAETVLQDNDKIMIGRTLFGFFLRDEAILRAEERLIQRATTDSMTGLNNRAAFDEQMQKEFAVARRAGGTFSLLLFDLDFFKLVNDNHGHLMGDYVLEQVGKIVLNAIRISDFPARYGGEEFALILPGADLKNAAVQGERLRQSVARHRFVFQKTEIRITMSVGAAALSDAMTEPADLIRAADEALYRAKNSGRNRLEVA